MTRGSAIRHLAACDASSLIAAAFFESTVQIWNWDVGEQIGEFQTILDFGGHRLALASKGAVCITGSWKRGLAAYSVPDGACLWQRPDLKRVQELTLNPAGEQVHCGFEDRPLAVIDAATGRIVRTVKNALAIYASPFSRCELIEERGHYQVAGDHAFEVPALSFALNDAAFSPESVCISEPKGGIRCIDLVSGNQLWHHPLLWTNYLTFCVSDFNFYCAAMTNFTPHDGSLLRLAPTLIDCDQVAFIGPCWESAFSQSGEVLVTSQGDVYQTSTGRLLKELAFPQMDYDD